MILNNILFISRILSAIFIFIVVFIDKKKPESTIAWVLILIYAPYIGVFFYIMLSEMFHFNIKKKDREKITNNIYYKEKINKQIELLTNNEKLKKQIEIADLMLLNSNADSLITVDNDIRVYTKGVDKYADLFADIENAKSFIHISYYIIKRDYYGKKLVDLLIKKVKEGVEVRLIFDHIGSRYPSKRFFKGLIKAGGKVEKFFPSTVLFKPCFNHRNHRKMVIIDGKIAYTGGMNIGKEYCNEDKKIYPWADRHLRIEGNGVISLQSQFFLDYLFVSKEKINFEEKMEQYFPLVQGRGNKIMQIVSSGPDYKDENIKNAYFKMINDAKKSILIETPYLILDDSMMDAIKVAIKSGVEIKIVIPGVPDKKVVYAATLSYARELIKMGVKIYAYKGFMHSKIILYDDIITSIGSANMDRRSFSINFEVNAFIYDKEFNEINRALIEKDIENSEYLNETIKKKNKLGLWWERIFRLFAPMM